MPLESANNVNGLNILWPLGDDVKGEGDNHLKMIKTVLKNSFPSLSGMALRNVPKTTNYTVAKTDNFVIFDTTGELVFTVEAAATLGQHIWGFYVRSGTLQIDPNGAEQINGASDALFGVNTWGFVLCDGAKFTTLSTATLPAGSVNTAALIDGAITFAKLAAALGADIPIATPAGDDWSLFLDTSNGLALRRTQSLVPAGSIIDWAGNSAPAGYAALPTVPTNVPRTGTYAQVFANIGTVWGAGDGSTTFGLPYVAADGATLMSSGNVGTATNGQHIAHSHGVVAQTFGGVSSTPRAVSGNQSGSDGGIDGSLKVTGYDSTAVPLVIASSGGSQNVAAGSRFLKCIKL